MTILEQILAGLQQKFAGVDTAILTRIATKKAEGVTDETKVNSIVEGISFSDVLNSYGDFRAGNASKTAVSNYEKKHNLKDGKPIETTTTTKTEENKDDVSAWAQALIDSNKNLSDKLTQFEAEKAQATRSQQILAKAKEYGIPENYVKRCAIKDDKNVRTIDDLRIGMELPGIVGNITNFGAFVDIGIKENGLIHLSQLAQKYVSNPNEIVSIHQQVRVKVLSVDTERKRIQLTMIGVSG